MLHHWDKVNSEIEIGGTLLPEYWGIGLMAEAFKQLEVIAFYDFNVRSLVARIQVDNVKAIRFAEKFGFKRSGIFGREQKLAKAMFNKVRDTNSVY